MLTSTLCVIHCLPSAIRLEEYVGPGAFCACAESRCKNPPNTPSAMVSATDSTQRRIDLVLYVIVIMNDPHRAPNHSTRDFCVFREPARRVKPLQNGGLHARK